jgi:hypothetical protein
VDHISGMNDREPFRQPGRKSEDFVGRKRQDRATGCDSLFQRRAVDELGDQPRPLGAGIGLDQGG